MTPRSLALGLGGTVLICALSPYNDYVLNNTFLVGNNLPLGVVVLLFLFVVCVNAPLRRWRPSWAWSHAELAGGLAMMLVACAVPGSGFMRYFPSTLVGPWWQARGGGDYLTLLTSLRLPSWLFPAFRSPDQTAWPNDPVVNDFLGRWPGHTDPEAGVRDWPGWAWVRPAVNWLPFLAALATALLCLVVIVRKQWTDNERLPFPLAQLPLALVEEPAAGRALNATLRSRLFWLGLSAVLLLHVWNGLGLYLPRYIPRIPVAYDLSRLMAEPPLAYVDQKLKDAAVFFTVVGVTYFLASSISFSLWSFFLGYQFVRMSVGSATGDPTIYGQQDQHLGGVLAYLCVLIYTGRRHYASVFRQGLEPLLRPLPGQEHGRYLKYRWTVRLLLFSVAVMVGWLWLAGCELIPAAVMVAVLLATFVVIARVIAETGLVHGQLIVPVYKPWQLLAASGGLGGWGEVSTRSFFLGSMLQATHYDMREPLTVYASHGLKTVDADAGHPPSRRHGAALIYAMGLALFVGFVVSFASTLYTEYRFSATLDTPPRVPINAWGTETNPRTQMLDATLQYDRHFYFPRHSAALHVALGFALTGGLAALRLRFAGFPLHPVGFLMIGTYPGSHLWLSVFVGWACKQTTLKLGGTRLYIAGKPLFLGLVVGESLAAAFWMLGGVLLTEMNLPYRVVNIMPG